MTNPSPESGSPAILSDVLRCPSCSRPLHLVGDPQPSLCSGCGRRCRSLEGVLDLVTDPRRAEERAYYEAEYASTGSGPRRQIEDLATIWTHQAKPVNRELLRMLGPLTGERVALIGNGGSPRELYFLKDCPNLLVFSDLSNSGVTTVRDAFELGSYDDRLWFASLDALNLPFADGSLDVVYGNAIVHHLPDRERFLREVVRVLRPGGRAIFMDAAHVPAWQFAKRLLLRPLFAYSHRRFPRSPEDVRDTMEGGFREGELASEIRSLGAEPWFRRLSLTYYLWRRASLVLLPRRLRWLGEEPRIATRLIRLDEHLGRYRLARAHFVRLIWGLRTPS